LLFRTGEITIICFCEKERKNGSPRTAHFPGAGKSDRLQTPAGPHIHFGVFSFIILSSLFVVTIFLKVSSAAYEIASNFER